MATRLKRLDLHGFKSFATPTAFVFDTGITAVIGPNGSGKSNISDALRWVLGEQSYTNLRGRRTEDIIFAGSSTRTPLGMAEVTVTLDNEDGSLPVAFSEVSVTRRAYRSGENQYLINGARVRLKDVLQVTASLGQSHTVIGQGLVDAVLSQRADERRGLFEHAAGITGLRIKHASAGRNLEESHANCTRLEDLLADLEPRLRSLERAARQAREYDNVRQQLRTALERFYARHWIDSTDRLRAANGAADALDLELSEATQARDNHRRVLAQAADATTGHARALDSLSGEIQRLRDEHQRCVHDLALIEERQRSARTRRGDAERSLDAIHTSIVDLTREIDDVAATTSALSEDTASRQQQLAQLESAHDEAQHHVNDLDSQLRAVQQKVAGVERDVMLMETRVTLLRGQLEQIDAERQRHQSGSVDRANRRDEIKAQWETAGESAAATSRRIEDLTSQMRAMSEKIATGVEERDTLVKRRTDIERRVVEAGTRYETLKRLAESGVGLYSGVKHVLDASRKNKLSGILGTLASLLIVPAELEAAIEAALGSHLQDLVVERWPDAERAIALLKQSQSGRATFHPLDTVRNRGRSAVPSLAPGIRGMATDLIEMDERVRPVVDGLLGRVQVADDLDAARAALRSLSPGWSVVTIGGEIVRSSGTVTGGSRIKETGALARERELRELPRLRTRLEKQRSDQSAELETVEAILRRQIQSKSEIEENIASARAELRELSATRERAERQLSDIARDDAAARERFNRLEQQSATLCNELTELSRARDEGEARLARIAGESELLKNSLLDARKVIDDEQLLRARSELSGIRERLRSAEEQRIRLEARKQDLGGELIAGGHRLTELDQAIRALVEAREKTVVERDALGQRLAQQRERYATVQSEHTSSVRAEQVARQKVEQAEDQCRELERRQDHLALETARRRDELDLTLERAGRDLEAEGVETILARATAVETGDLPRVEREIGRLRERLRRIGVAGDDAIEQFERESERYTFLRQQLDDVRSATEALRALMMELDRTMALEFDRTFAEVARAFESTFTALFGGGKARLVRSDDENGSTGIDIVAQPPGKRLQNLSLLSGGERALTAVALLFSILKVNPSPFCLLDEVDAALDESNVVRVRDELQRLAEKTQFVVVTHNRSTIEGADTLYGITMGDDGLSRVLSLKLPAESIP